MSRTTLVVNCGSSSIKHRLYDEDERELCRGAVEGVGAASGVAWLRVAGGEKQRQEAAIPDHGDGLRLVCDALDAAAVIAGDGPSVVAHRVVHGGARFTAPAVVDDAVLAELDRLTPLAPLHNPANVLGVRLASERFPRATHVAVFDTAFHATAPDHATRYAVPKRLAIEHGVRRYGFHGASHAWASRRAAELLGRPVRELRTVVLHLGAGASACAVDCGRSIDTSMGMTPLEGLVMATRSGDLDPGVVLFLQRELGLSSDE
ncbi:MAG: acetate kinase, partial [Planctomycetota bacterium]